MIDGHTSQSAHHGQKPFAAGFDALLFDVLIRVRLLFALGLGLGILLLQLFHLGVLVGGEDGIHLHIAVVRILDIGIARNGYGGSAGTVLRNADEHHGVGIFLTIGHAGVQVRQFLLREGVALGIGTRILAHQQDIHRAIERVTGQALAVQGQVRGRRHAIIQPTHGGITHARYDQDQGRQECHDRLDGRGTFLLYRTSGRGRRLDGARPASVLRSHKWRLSRLVGIWRQFRAEKPKISDPRPISRVRAVSLPSARSACD